MKASESDNGQTPAQLFNALRPTLQRAAYHMLGSIADAEDIVQDTWMKWHDVDHRTIRDPAAFLHKIVTRLCLNELKCARRARETYIGPWLPEPFVEPDVPSGPDILALPLMVALQRLSPPERAAFLLHDMFGLDFAEIALVIDRSPAACRKLASRARAHITDGRTRFAVDREAGRRMATAFYTASRNGDITALRELLAEDVILYTDGGGRVAAPRKPVAGRADTLRFFEALARYFLRHPSRLLRHATINGLPGFLTVEAGSLLQTTALRMEEGRIESIYVVRNPDKLGHLKQELATRGHLGGSDRACARAWPR